jgi:magnesium transporter
MPRLIKRISSTLGLAPGTVVHVGEKKVDKVRITIIDYDEAQYAEKEAEQIEDCFSFKETPSVTWINVDGLHRPEVVEKIGERFGLHPLIQEDIVNTGQRPKIEDLEDYLFVVLKMLYYDEKDDQVRAEQVSLILGANFVITFQEKQGDVFNAVRERIRKGKGIVRKRGVDYLAYALIDAVVDHYFLILERFSEMLEEMEGKVIADPTPETLQTIHSMKREMIFLRKSVWPLREVISGLERGQSALIKKRTHIYLRDVYDHTIQVIDTVESLRDMVSGMLDTYLSSMSNRMNEVMKVLTIFASIFIPLTFIAGIYGMNFQHMPELLWRGGYFIVLAVMGAVGISMVIYFRRRKWL